MILTAMILSAPILAVWLARRGQRVEPPREFNPDWGSSCPSRASHQRAEMRRLYAESGLPPEPRHPYFDHLHRESWGATGSG